MPSLSFDQLVATCTQSEHNGPLAPYDYQRAVAERGLPELLTVPTGAGKTMAVVLGWLYRRRYHPDPTVRSATPHWLIVCQPMRTLVEQVRADVYRWLASLVQAGHDVPLVHVFLGGEPALRDEWRSDPGEDAIVIGTQDMLLSRALNRGFGSSRYVWPVEFGALNNGTHWVYDEVQLMGAAVPTGRQLAALRKRWPSLLPTESTWMSATISDDILATVDNPSIGTRIGLSEGDRSGHLARRLQAGKRVTELHLPTDPKQRSRALAAAVLDAHRPGTLTIAINNTVPAAQQLHAALEAAKSPAELLLLHSRFRPGDRRRLVDRLDSPLSSTGRIVVSTQVIEAGMDLDAAVLFTEAAPWPSVVQRFGRCNRSGATAGAHAYWFSPLKPDKPLPYEADEVNEAIQALRDREGKVVVPDGLADALTTTPRLHPVLRGRDLLALFDTTADIGGADLDVSPFVRDRRDDATVHIAWRNLPESGEPIDEPKPTQQELCPAPLGGQLTQWIKANRVLRYDVIERSWLPANPADLRPNAQLLTDCAAGGYSATRGWDPESKAPVETVDARDREVDPQAERFDAPEDDSASIAQKSWVTLDSHLRDTEREADRLFAVLAINDDELRRAVCGAAGLHDLGKTHPVFQDTMRRAAAQAGWPGYDENAPLAKSSGHARHERKFFRHELATALALLDENGASVTLDTFKPDLRFLITYLTAAHHGRIRMTLRSLPGEEGTHVLGIADGEILPGLVLDGEPIPDSSLQPAQFTGLGLHPTGVRPWFERADELLRQFGPFNLALLEAVVRLADWRASSTPSEPLT